MLLILELPCTSQLKITYVIKLLNLVKSGARELKLQACVLARGIPNIMVSVSEKLIESDRYLHQPQL